MKDAGHLIEAGRIRQGLTQAALAAALGVSRHTVRHWEVSTAQLIPPGLFHQLCTVLQIDPREILSVLGYLDTPLPAEPAPEPAPAKKTQRTLVAVGRDVWELARDAAYTDRETMRAFVDRAIRAEAVRVEKHHGALLAMP